MDALATPEGLKDHRGQLKCHKIISEPRKSQSYLLGSEALHSILQSLKHPVLGRCIVVKVYSKGMPFLYKPLVTLARSDVP